MHRVNVVLDIDQEYLMEERESKTDRKGKQKHDNMIKLNDDLFEIALRKGLIEKTDDGYVFVGDYEELLAFKKRKHTP